MIKQLVLLVIVCLLSQGADIEWHRTFDSDNDDDELFGLCRSYNGGVLVVGQSYVDGLGYMLVLQYDRSGSLEWSDVHYVNDACCAMDACTIDEALEYMVLGGSYHIGAGTYNVMLSRYNQNGTLLETEEYIDYGIGTTIKRLSNGDYIITGWNRCSSSYSPFLMRVNDDNLNVIWYRPFTAYDIDLDWERVYLEITPNDEILIGFLKEQVWSSTYKKWINSSHIAVCDPATGYVQDTYNPSAILPSGSSYVIAGISSEARSNGNTSEVIISLMADTEPHYPIVLTDIQNSSFNNLDHIELDNQDVRANAAFTNGEFQKDGAIINIYRKTDYYLWLFEFTGENTCVQEFSLSSGDLETEDIHYTSGLQVDWSEAWGGLAGAERIGTNKFSIVMTSHGSNSDAFTCFWSFSYFYPISLQDNDTNTRIWSNSVGTVFIELGRESVTDEYDVHVYDLVGRQVHSISGCTNASGQNTIIINPDDIGLETGLYLLQIECGGCTLNHKFTVMN